MSDQLGNSIFLKPDDVVRAFEARGALQPTVRWSEMMHGDHAVGFTVAKIAKLDLLRTLRASIDDVLRNGGTYEGWKAGILPELKKAGWWGAVTNPELTGTDKPIIVNNRRLRTIYNTNVRMSMATGHWARIQRQKDVLPYLRYLPSTSEHKRPLHKSWYGILLPIDHIFWQTHFPPNGWGCKCHFEQVSERKMRRMGWVVTPDDQLPQAARRFFPAYGDAIMVPDGIDPGFSYNPGTAHLRAVAAKAANSIQQALDAGLDDAARATLRQIVDDVAFEQFIALPNPGFPVMILNQQLQTAIGSKARLAILSDTTVAKQFSKRPDLPLAIYRQLPQLSDRADIVALDGENVLIFAREADGQWTVAIMKRTASGEGLYVTSVRSQNGRSLPRLLNGTEIILDRR